MFLFFRFPCEIALNSVEFCAISSRIIWLHFAEFRDLFHVQNLYVSKGTPLNAPVVQTRTVAAQTPVLLTRPGVAQPL